MRTTPFENKLAITIDVEDWYHVPSVTGSPYSLFSNLEEFFARWQGRYDYLSGPTKEILRILDEYRVDATFFVVADVAERYPGLVESIAARGHEIACHGLHHACKIDPRSKEPLMTPEQFVERTRKAKSVLEGICGERVIGYRAPNGYLGRWMFEHLYRLGFRYDSSVSVNSLYNKTDMRLNEISSRPYRALGESVDFTEFPWAYLSILGFKIPTSGGPMLRFLGAKVILAGLRQSLRRGHTVFYIHPIDISRERFPAVTRWGKAFWRFKGEKTEARLRYLLSEFKARRTKTTCLRDLINM